MGICVTTVPPGYTGLVGEIFLSMPISMSGVNTCSGAVAWRVLVPAALVAATPAVLGNAAETSPVATAC